MDVQLALRVLWRFRLLVALGLVAALALAILSYYRIPSMQPRDNQQWESLSTLFVTSHGFPWGEVPQTDVTNAGAGTPDAGRLSQLASLYMELATGDAVLRRMREDGPLNGKVQTFPVFVARDSGNPALPMITLSAISSSPKAARTLAERHLAAFRSFIEERQAAAAIPEAERVVVEVVREPSRATLLVPRKKTRPILVFLTVLFATAGLAFVLENLRPRIRTVAVDGGRSVAATAVAAESSRMSA